MSERTFVTNIEQCLYPSDVATGLGRTLRLTIDINLSAVQDYIYESSGANEWNRKLFDEIFDALAGVAQQEQTLAMFARMRS